MLSFPDSGAFYTNSPAEITVDASLGVPYVTHGHSSRVIAMFWGRCGTSFPRLWNLSNALIALADTIAEELSGVR